MIRHSQISLPRFILSLSDALDNVTPVLTDHQQRVAFIALSMARQMNVDKEDYADLFLAAALHDIGLIRVENRILLLNDGDQERVGWHSETGHELLSGQELFADAARIIRFHHTDWELASTMESSGQEVPVGSHIIHVADCAERMIDRNTNILEQASLVVEWIARMSGRLFCPDCIRAFQTVARFERFWLDCMSPRIDRILLGEVEEVLVDATDQIIQEIAEIFARMVDAVSPWTTTHSAAVAGSAMALAERMGFSSREQNYMRTAGLLHDLGKLTVPSRILNHTGQYSEREWAIMKSHTYHTYRILEDAGFPRPIIEWASFHHEQLDGRGYPFHHSDADLTLGARIMAVADAFTSLGEDRPHRKGLHREEILSTLRKMVSHNVLDNRVFTVLERYYEDIEVYQQREKGRYADIQDRLVSAISEDENPKQTFVQEQPAATGFYVEDLTGQPES